jgi:hypothetical protein
MSRPDQSAAVAASKCSRYVVVDRDRDLTRAINQLLRSRRLYMDMEWYSRLCPPTSNLVTQKQWCERWALQDASTVLRRSRFWVSVSVSGSSSWLVRRRRRCSYSTSTRSIELRLTTPLMSTWSGTFGACLSHRPSRSVSHTLRQLARCLGYVS